MSNLITKTFKKIFSKKVPEKLLPTNPRCALDYFRVGNAYRTKLQIRGIDISTIIIDKINADGSFDCAVFNLKPEQLTPIDFSKKSLENYYYINDIFQKDGRIELVKYFHEMQNLFYELTKKEFAWYAKHPWLNPLSD